MDDDDIALDPWATPDRLRMARSEAFANPTGIPAKSQRVKAAHRRRTRGGIPLDREAVVYVAEGDGMTKIGITTNAATRAHSLRMRMVYTRPVVPAAAREVEARAFDVLRVDPVWFSEWQRFSRAEMAAAVDRAFDLVGRYMHVDPSLSAEEDRRRRITLAMPAKVW